MAIGLTSSGNKRMHRIPGAPVRCKGALSAHGGIARFGKETTSRSWCRLLVSGAAVSEDHRLRRGQVPAVWFGSRPSRADR